MKIKGLLSIIIAIFCGLVVLAGYLLRLPLFLYASNLFLNWAVLLAAFAALLGIFNLLIVHLGKIAGRQKGAAYSLLLVIAMLGTLGIGLLIPFFPRAAPVLDFIFRTFQLPVEASLMALLTITLTYASIRLLGRRLSVFSIIFIATMILVLLGTAPLPWIGNLPWVSDLLRPVIAQVLAASGARGILIGVALGALVTGLRVLFGADQPYGGK